MKFENMLHLSKAHLFFFSVLSCNTSKILCWGHVRGAFKNTPSFATGA